MVGCDRKKGREQFLQKHVANDRTRHNSGCSECGRSSASREDIKIASKISIFTWMSIIFEKNHRGEKKKNGTQPLDVISKFAMRHNFRCEAIRARGQACA